MKLDKLLELTKENYYLHKTTYLSHIPEAAFRKKLVEYYNHDLEEIRIMGSVLNSIYTEGKTTFHFSKRSLEKLIKNDTKNLEGKGRPKISLGKDGHKVNFFRQKLVEIFKNTDSFEVLKEASTKHKTPAVVDFYDDKLYGLMDEFGGITKKLKKLWKETALDSVLLIEKKMESESESAQVAIPRTSSVSSASSNKKKNFNGSALQKDKEVIDVTVDLSMDSDDWVYDHLKSME